MRYVTVNIIILTFFPYLVIYLFILFVAFLVNFHKVVCIAFPFCQLFKFPDCRS